MANPPLVSRRIHIPTDCYVVAVDQVFSLYIYMIISFIIYGAVMQPLHDRTGQVYAWLDIKTEHILDLGGRPIAFIVGDSVYDWSGRHIGWWQDGHMRDNGGAVVVF